MRFSKLSVAGIFTFLFFTQVTLLAQQNNSPQHTTKKTPTAATPKPADPLDEVINAVYAAARFEQTAISPDGEKIA